MEHDPNSPNVPSPEINRSTRIMAFIGKICPFCNAWRIMPNTRIGRFLKQRQSGCPACNAYRQVYAADEEDTEARR